MPTGLEKEIGRDLRRVKAQMRRATRREDLRRDARARRGWREIKENLKMLLEVDVPDSLKNRLTSLVDKLVVEEIMTS